MREETRQPGPSAPTSLPVRVLPHGEEGGGESTRLFNISARGATLLLARAPELGQLLRLQLTAPGRAPSKQSGLLLALVWAVTPPDSRLAVGAAGEGLHRVSVLFVDDEAPAPDAAASRYTYLAEDDGRFRLQRPQADPPRAAGRRSRRHSRIRIPVEVTLELLGADGAPTAREQTVTENISRGGAAVLTSLDAAARHLVRLTSARLGVAITAVVRARRKGPDQIPRLHLEFIDGQWPIERLQ
jgi:hypothetical protein